MHYSELSQLPAERQEEFRNVALNMPTVDWPQPDELADVVCSFGVVKVPYDDWQAMLEEFNA